MRAVISSMRSRGNGGALSGRMAMLIPCAAFLPKQASIDCQQSY
jgi:hypothetical protein